PGDVVWLPNGARNNYWSTSTSRFFYTTWPVNWPDIVGWEAGKDVKDLAAQGGAPGSFDGIVTSRRAEARFAPFPCESGAKVEAGKVYMDRTDQGGSLGSFDGIVTRRRA